MLDKIPSWLRHLLIVLGATFLGSVIQDVVGQGGVVGLDWQSTLLTAVDAAAVATATAAAALWGLPITRQYGAGARDALRGPDGVYRVGR